MPLAQLPEAFNHDDWIFEIKYDGWRALASAENGRARLVSRKNHPDEIELNIVHAQEIIRTVSGRSGRSK
jgi:hypothetical protein